MKKTIAAIMIGALCFTGLVGCAGNSKITDNVETPVVTTEASKEEDKTKQEEQKSDDKPEKPEAKPEADLSTQEGIRSYLAGEWTLLDRKKGADFGTLSIKADGSFEFNRLSDGATGSGTLSFENMESKKGEEPDWFNLALEDCGTLVPEGEQLYGDEGTSGIFHIGTFGDEDYLYLKEISNGDSVMSMYAFNTNADSDEIGNWPRDWLFYRKGDGENTAQVMEDDTFYAWAWELNNEGDGVWLQPMKEHEFETYEDYSNRRFTGGYFTETKDIGIAYYELAGADLDGLVNTADWNSGYPLMMCEVTTDSDGTVKELRDVDIAMYNVYDMGELDPEYSFEGTTFTINGADIDMSEYVAETDRIIDCKRAGDWIIVECYVSPYSSTYEFYNIPNGDMGYFEYEITGTQLTWRGDDLSTAVYVRDDKIYDFWGNLIAYVDDGEIGRISITGENTVSAQIHVTDYAGRLKEYVQDYEYEPCDLPMLAYYESMLGGTKQWRRFKELAGDAAAFVIVNPPVQMLDRMRSSVTFAEGALDKVAVIPLFDDARITIESTDEGAFNGDKKQPVTEEVQKGRAVVFDVTVSEGLPTSMITVRSPWHDDVTWDVVQISGRIPQRSTFVD